MVLERILAAAAIAVAVPVHAAPLVDGGHARRLDAVSEEFAADLETCIRDNAKLAAEAFPTWGNGCMPPTFKVDLQAAQLRETLATIRKKWGYQAALWCTFYSTRMGSLASRVRQSANDPLFR